MKKLTILFVLLGCFFFSISAHAEKTTYLIGNTGYMIREAMHAGAQKHSTQLYRQALKLQSQAKQALRNRGIAKAKELTLQAYELAKQARDQALAITGKKFANYR